MVLAIFLLSGGAASIAYFKENLEAYLDIDNCEDSAVQEDTCNSYIKIFSSQIAAGVSLCIASYITSCVATKPFKSILGFTH